MYLHKYYLHLPTTQVHQLQLSFWKMRQINRVETRELIQFVGKCNDSMCRGEQVSTKKQNALYLQTLYIGE